MSWYVVNFEVKHFHIIPMFVLTFICTFIFIRCWKEKYATSLFILSEWSGQNVTLISILNWRSEWTPKKRYSFASYPVCVLQCINILGRLINRVLNAIYRFSNILNILWNENDSCEGKKLHFYISPLCASFRWFALWRQIHKYVIDSVELNRIIWARSTLLYLCNRPAKSSSILIFVTVIECS